MDRFWSKVDVQGPEECWPWLRGINNKGYGNFRYEGRSQHAHRVSWQIYNGQVPDGKQVLHSCDNPPCCNPAHLWLGTNLDNARDRNNKGRQAKGERHGQAKITANDVREIRSRAALGEMQKDIAIEFGISPKTVSNIVTRRKWAWLTDGSIEPEVWELDDLSWV